MDHLHSSLSAYSSRPDSENASDHGDSDSSFESYSYDYVYVYPYGAAWLATVPLICSLIIVVTVVGNLMVIAAYFWDKRIRANVSNLFILNLAITDLTVGFLMWPITLSWLIKDYWSHGEIFCKLWLIVDYTMTMVSALTLLLISWDRYCLLKMGMQYQKFQTKKRIGLIILLMWTAVFGWYTFLAFAWSPITGRYNIDYTWECEMEFSSSLATTLVANVFEFFIPFTSLIILNIAVYINIKRRSRGIVGPNPPHQLRRFTARSAEDTEESQRHETSFPTRNAAMKDQRKVAFSSTSPVETATIRPSGPQEDGNQPSSSDIPQDSRRERQTFARHRKAALVLAILVGFFLVCWVPIQVATIMFAICGHNCVSYVNWEVTNALVWSNSMINPFIYASTNIHFRRNFRRFLFLDRWACDAKQCKVKCRY